MIMPPAVRRTCRLCDASKSTLTGIAVAAVMVLCWGCRLIPGDRLPEYTAYSSVEVDVEGCSDGSYRELEHGTAGEPEESPLFALVRGARGIEMTGVDVLGVQVQPVVACRSKGLSNVFAVDFRIQSNVSSVASIGLPRMRTKPRIDPAASELPSLVTIESGGKRYVTSPNPPPGKGWAYQAVALAIAGKAPDDFDEPPLPFPLPAGTPVNVRFMVYAGGGMSEIVELPLSVGDQAVRIKFEFHR